MLLIRDKNYANYANYANSPKCFLTYAQKPEDTVDLAGHVGVQEDGQILRDVPELINLLHTVPDLIVVLCKLLFDLFMERIKLLSFDTPVPVMSLPSLCSAPHCQRPNSIARNPSPSDRSRSSGFPFPCEEKSNYSIGQLKVPSQRVQKRLRLRFELEL